MKRLLALASLAFPALAFAGLQPHWSIKLQQAAAGPATNVHIVDSRPDDEKKFRMEGFLKLAYKAYLGDANTSPDRMAILGARLGQSASARPDGMTVEVQHFDILQDLSGSACKGCALAAVSPAAESVVDADRKVTDDTYTCSLTATLDGNAASGEITVPFHRGAFDTNNSAPSVAALQACVDGAIDRWTDKALHPGASGKQGE